jgi:hypothetical protein
MRCGLISRRGDESVSRSNRHAYSRCTTQGSPHVSNAMSHYCSYGRRFRQLPDRRTAQVAATQIKLTAKQIEGFITAQDDARDRVARRVVPPGLSYQAAHLCVSRSLGLVDLWQRSLELTQFDSF